MKKEIWDRTFKYLQEELVKASTRIYHQAKFGPRAKEEIQHSLLESFRMVRSLFFVVNSSVAP